MDTLSNQMPHLIPPLFLLQKDEKTISLNSFENEEINELAILSISEHSIYTTDQKSKVAILDTTKNNVVIFDLDSSNQFRISIPFDIDPKSILLYNNSLFIGGQMGKEMLIQYQLQNDIWYQLEIPNEIMRRRKAVDDLIINDCLLIAIDNVIWPKYVLYYHLNSLDKLRLSHFRLLKSNGPNERIYQGRISDNYFGVLSETWSGYTGKKNHITIYENLELESSFCISSLNYHPFKSHIFTDFLIIKDVVIIASRNEGLGILKIKQSYFENSDKHNIVNDNIIKYANYKDSTITKLTLIPHSEKIILRLTDDQGVTKHEITEV